MAVQWDMERQPLMPAAFITQPGPAGSIRTGFLPVPEPAPDEVLVRLGTSTVNQVDLFIRSGAFPVELPLPFIIGRDLVGTVEKTGSAATRFAPGDRVWTNSLGHGGRQGSFARFCTVAEDRLYPLPAGVDPAEAVIVLHPAATAWLGLHREARVHAGDTLVVEGAAGAVGSAVLQLASRSGLRIVATASAASAGWCREAGAAEVVDYASPDVYADIAALTPEGVTVWWDTSGRQRFREFVPLMAPGGRIVVMSGLEHAGAAPLPVGPFYTRDLSLHGFAISNATAAELQDAAETINRLLASGVLRGRIGAHLRLTEAREAHRLLETGAVSGRIVISE